MVEVVVLVLVSVVYPLVEGKDGVCSPDSCSQVLMEMIVMGEYIFIEGRYSKAFVKVLELVCGTPIHMFPLDEDYIGVAITCRVSVMKWALV
jgi:hypothetical protein